MTTRPVRGTASLLLAGVLFACRAAAPAASGQVEAWRAMTDSLAATLPADAPARARVRALASLAMYEGFAADGSTGLHSLAGQVNGLWRMPGPAGRRDIDGAIAAAEAQRLVLDSLLARDAPARLMVDSLARSQLAARRAAGIRAEVAQRSLEQGAAVAKNVLTLTSRDAPRTFVLRHPDECAVAATASAFAVTAQGEPAAAGPAPLPASAHAAAEGRVLELVARADALAAAARVRAGQPDSAYRDCVGQRVRGRLRTRPVP